MIMQTRTIALKIQPLSFLLVWAVFFLSSCQKDEKVEPLIKEVSETFSANNQFDQIVKGDSLKIITDFIDEELRTQERIGSPRGGNDKYPFNFIGYDKLIARRVYNTKLEISGYSFVAFTDDNNPNRYQNLVVTLKKNGKPSKPQIYEYTLSSNPNNTKYKYISKITVYKANGIKVDLPSATSNFNPCEGVVCNETPPPPPPTPVYNSYGFSSWYNYGGGTFGSSYGGYSGGGVSDYWGNPQGTVWGSGYTGYGGGGYIGGGLGYSGSYGSTVPTCWVTYKSDAPTLSNSFIQTTTYYSCSDGSSYSIISVRPIYAFTDPCCDLADSDIGPYLGKESQLTRNSISNLIASNESLSSLQATMSTLPPWLSEILFEAIKDVLIGTIEKQLKLDLADDVKDAISSAASADLAGFLYNALDVVKRLYPGLKVANTVIDFGSLSVRAHNLIKNFSKMANTLGSDSASKVIRSLKGNVPNIVDDIVIDSWPLGINVNNCKSEDVFNSLAAQFGGVIYKDENKPSTFIIKLPSIIFTRYQRTSTSGPGIAINGNQFKFSFNE
jgi:hypothetical protein